MIHFWASSINSEGPIKALTYADARAKLKKLTKGYHDHQKWNPENLEAHFGVGQKSDHSAMYPGWTINQYERWFYDLLEYLPDNKSLFGFETEFTRLRFSQKQMILLRETEKTA